MNKPITMIEVEDHLFLKSPNPYIEEPAKPKKVKKPQKSPDITTIAPAYGSGL